MNMCAWRLMRLCVLFAVYRVMLYVVLRVLLFKDVFALFVMCSVMLYGLFVLWVLV